MVVVDVQYSPLSCIWLFLSLRSISSSVRRCCSFFRATSSLLCSRIFCLSMAWKGKIKRMCKWPNGDSLNCNKNQKPENWFNVSSIWKLEVQSLSLSLSLSLYIYIYIRTLQSKKATVVKTVFYALVNSASMYMIYQTQNSKLINEEETT